MTEIVPVRIATCPVCGCVMSRAGHPEMSRPHPGKDNTKQQYRCTNKSCRARTVNPVWKREEDIVDVSR